MTPLLIGIWIEFLDLFFNQREHALPNSDNQRICLASRRLRAWRGSG